jgi:hypothetical protein
VLERVVDMCGERGLMVVLAMHRLKETDAPAELW